MTTTIAKRRKAVLDVLTKHEEMAILLSCLSRSPLLYEESDEDDEDETLKESLEERGLLAVDDTGIYVTTTEGRDALVAYVCGDDEDAEDELGQE